jgi:hypothetical protein
MARDDAERSAVSVTALVVTLLVFGLLSIPLAGLSWDMLSDLISGHLAARKAAYGIPSLAALFIALRFAGRALVRLDKKPGVARNTVEPSRTPED